jgi:hypothetical protein
MSKRFLAVSLALCAPFAGAAPAPPVRLVTAEAVLKPPRGNPRELAAMLTSAQFLSGVAKSRPVVLGRLGGLRYEKDPASWLAARLKADVDDGRGTVTLRLVDCPRKDAVARLSAVVEAYKAEMPGQGRRGRGAGIELRVAFVNPQPNLWAVAVPTGGAIQLVETTTLNGVEAGPTKAEVDASVVQPPRVVQPGLPGKSAPAAPSSR